MAKWLNRALSAFLVMAILAAIGAIIYTISAPEGGEKFTEFYILGPESKAENYPRQIKMGDSAQVIVGIVNHEQQAITYRLEVLVADVKNIVHNPISLAAGEKWQQPASFTPSIIGANQKVLFNLYKGDAAEPYLQLHLWIDVVK